MFKRVVAVAGVATALTFALVAPAASASSGPPPPVSTNGHKVELVASGLKTPTSFAFGDGRVFVGDGGNSEGSAPPNGGVYVLKNGTAVKIASPLKFVAGLAWHDNKLYISGAVLANGRPSWRLICVERLEWHDVHRPARRCSCAGKKFDGFNGIGFGADGRLYVGVDVGLTDGNDHGPASTSPYLYDILTFSANGTGPARSSRRAYGSRGSLPSSQARTRRSSPTLARTLAPRTRRTSCCTCTPATTTASRSATRPCRRSARASRSRSARFSPAHRPDGHRAARRDALPDLFRGPGRQGTGWRGVHPAA